MVAMKYTCSVREVEIVEIDSEDCKVLDDVGKEYTDKSEEPLKKVFVHEGNEERFFLLGFGLA